MLNSSSYKTSLYPLHNKLGGKMVDFAGYLLPLSYNKGGLLAEHLQTRKAASLFDVSHMGQIYIKNSDAATTALSTLMPADISAIAANSAKYTMLINKNGGIIDDCIITRDGDAGWYIVLNASRKAVDIKYIREALTAAGADNDAFAEYTDHALLAIQGPAAEKCVAKHFAAVTALRFMQSTVSESAFGECRISRCGYTGEDGFEISVSNDNACKLMESLLADCTPAGLGARNSLRLEAGLCLYGNELTETISPIEAGLLWTIPKSRRTADAGYNGAAIIHQQIQDGAKRRLVALLPQSKVPVRHDNRVYNQKNKIIGSITSGVYSPTLEAPIALALITTDTAIDEPISVEVRGRNISCLQTTLPFVPHNYQI